MSDQHYTGQIAQAAVDILRSANVADGEIWRDRVVIAHDEDDPLDKAVAVMTGPEQIVERGMTHVDVLLDLPIGLVARGDPSAMTGSPVPASTRLGDLRRHVTRVLLNDTTVLGATLNLGLAYVIDIIETGASEAAPEEESQWPLMGQTMNWQVLYRRSRVDPGANP